MNQSSQSSQSSQSNQLGRSTPSSFPREPRNPGAKHVRIHFDLIQDESGYPPADSETMWAIVEGDDRYCVDNIPFFIYGVSCYDIISAREGPDGLLRFGEIIQGGGHSTLRMIFRGKKLAATGHEVSRLRDALKKLGCPTEKSHIPGLISVDVPPVVSLASVKGFLESGAMQRLWGYEEATLAHDR